MKCPLCNSRNTKIIQNIKVFDIVKLYKKKFNFDVSPYFKTEIIIYAKCNYCFLEFFYPPTAGDEKFYDYLSKEEWYYQKDKNEYEIARNYINNKDAILEIGAGTGEFYNVINCKNYTGLELNNSAVIKAKSNGINLINCNVQDFCTYNKNKYDIVCSFQVLEHVNYINSFLDAQIKCLKKGGKLIISIPAKDSFLSFTTNDILNLPPHHMSRWPDKTIKYLVKLFNLELLNIAHESLQPVHEKWFLFTLINHIIYKILGWDEKIVDISIRRKFINKFLNRIIAKRFPSGAVKGFFPRGHTVVAIFKKI